MYKCIHRIFEERVEQAPQAIAVIGGEELISYHELNERANRLAHHLQSLGVGPDVMVALDLERSPNLIVSLLGILKAGGAFVPLDKSYPEERRKYMLADTNAPFLIDKRWIQANASAILKRSAENPDSGARPEHLAYVMYTSGSTGRPKGVMIEHRSVVRLVRETNYVDLTANEVILQMAPVSFDASTFEIWGALLNGGRLVLMPPHTPSLDEIAGAIERYGITTMWLTAGLFHVMVDRRLNGLATLRQLLAGGDVLSPTHVRRFLDGAPDTRLINGYGPTENTTFTCCHSITHGMDDTVSIGRPISGTTVYLLDADMRPVDPGTPGELYAGGDGVARGYLNRPELTEERFISDPFAHDTRARIYKTGDLARQRPDGAMEFLGRYDDQIKWNGFRIEPGEIETVLGDHPAVRQAVVVVRKDEGVAERRLVAYVVPEAPADLREYLASRLPAYMIPLAFVALAALPLTANGKVDRSALPSPAASIAASPAPSGRLERGIAGVWEKVLGASYVGMDDNFFDLGGDSLQLIEAHSELNRALGIDLSITDLFEYSTVGALAAHIGTKRASKPVFSAAQDRANKQREAQARQKAARVGVSG